jgi:hypothetical protein
MATNPPSGDGHRNGAMKERSQTYNPKTETWTKRDKETGQFMDAKKDGTPFKGVRKENRDLRSPQCFEIHASRAPQHEVWKL